MNKSNVFYESVLKHTCVGCGICVGICPNNALDMKFHNGIYQCDLIGDCLKNCKQCIKICPAINNDYDEISSTSDCFEFFLKDDDKRINSSSGGAIRFVLQNLLDKKLIDYVIFGTNSNNEFKFIKTNNLGDMHSSIYYPMNLSCLIKDIKDQNAKFAIISIPCISLGIDLLRKKVQFKDKIKFNFTLMCGGMKSAYFSEVLGNLAFKNDKFDTKFKDINYRFKIPNRSAMAFGFKFFDFNNNVAIDDRSKSAFEFYASRAYTPMYCNNCSMIFPKFSDAIFMDAWLNDKIKDYKGHSLIIANHPQILELFANEKENFCKKIDFDLVCLSQRDVKNLKENIIKFNQKIPLFDRLILRQKLIIQRHSNAHPYDLEFIYKKTRLIKRILKLKEILNLPKRVVNKIKRSLT